MQTGICFWCHTASPTILPHLLSPIWGSCASSYYPNIYRDLSSQAAMIVAVMCSSWFLSNYFFRKIIYNDLIQCLIRIENSTGFYQLKKFHRKTNEMVSVSWLFSCAFNVWWVSHVWSKPYTLSAGTSDLTFRNVNATIQIQHIYHISILFCRYFHSLCS